MSRRILFTAVRNEGPFLLEWLAYHRAIGFDRIVVAANDCDDGTDELLQALQAAGVLHHIAHQVPAEASPQGRAAALVNASGLIGDGDWVIWLDADEFLNIHAGDGRVDDLIAALGGAEGMLIPWRIFGDGGNAAFPGRFVSAAFTGAAAAEFAGNWSVKTFYRHRAGVTSLGAVMHRPRLARARPQGPERFLTAAGQPLDARFETHRRWLAGEELRGSFALAETERSWAVAQINHYMVRTKDLFALKRLRGRGFRSKRRLQAGTAAASVRHTDAFFQQHNRNDETDATLLRFEPATSDGILALRALPGVAAAEARIARRTQERLALAESAMTPPPPHSPDRSPKPPRPGPPAAEAGPPAAGPHAAPPLAAPPGVAPPPGPTAPIVTLPDAERLLVDDCYGKARTVLEYGSGGSTLLAARAGCDLVMSVESDSAWAANLQAVVARDFPGRAIHIHHEDIGPTKAWGRPRNDQGWRSWHRYPLAVWDQPWFRQPDVVLIDGRFRVACFLATLLRSEAPVTVLFDDYTPRPLYSYVERFAEPAAVVGRMARFELRPAALERRELTEIFAWFNDPE